jgi:hypothetical protein
MVVSRAFEQSTQAIELVKTGLLKPFDARSMICYSMKTLNTT